METSHTAWVHCDTGHKAITLYEHKGKFYCWPHWIALQPQRLLIEEVKDKESTWQARPKAAN